MPPTSAGMTSHELPAVDYNHKLPDTKKMTRRIRVGAIFFT